MNIPIYKPELPDYEKVEPDIREMYESGHLYPGKFTEALEARLSAELRVRHVHAVSSCSLGLMMLLSLLPEESEVIIPAFTFNATLQAVEWNRLNVQVIDVDSEGQLDPEKVELYIRRRGENVSAVMPVHMWGNACYPEEFERIGREYGVKVFFDGAHCLGTTYKDQHISRYGDGIVHSIAATKPLSAGEGGIFITNDLSLSRNFLDVANHGFHGSLDTRIKGTNGKIQEFNSILALHGLDILSRTKLRRRLLMDNYRVGLEGLPLRVWRDHVGTDPMYKDCTIFVGSPRIRQDLENYLNDRGIGTKRYFDPTVPEMGSFKGGCLYSYTTAKKLSQTCLNLPLYPALTDAEQEEVISKVREFFKD